MRILVTGATGFVGGQAARRLAEIAQVRCLVRSPQKLAQSHPAWEIVQGDLLDPTSLETAVAGVDLVVHAATDTNPVDRKRVWAVGVEGTRSLYAAARRAGVQRFIFISTAAVYAGSGTTEEDGPLPPSGDLYGDAKIEAERLLLDAPAGGPEVVILRPPIIYGPGSRWTRLFMDSARKGQLFLPAGGRFPFPCIHIDNMVDAIVAAVQAPAAQGAYNLFDGTPTYAEFVQPFLAAAGRQPKEIPYAMLWLVALGMEVAGKLTGRYMPLNRRNLAAMTRTGSGGLYSREKARRDLGWEPLLSFAEALQGSVAWALSCD